MNGGEKTYMLVYFSGMECAECRRHGTTLGRLAASTEGNPQVARAYCDLSAQHFCKAFQVENAPAIMLIKDRMVFNYSIEETGFELDSIKTFLDE